MSDEPIRYIDPKEFREIGFLQEANRQFFHPRGLALEVKVNEDGTEEIGGVWDYRDDPEGMIFGVHPDRAKAEAVDAELMRHVQARINLMGAVRQPLGWAPPPADHSPRVGPAGPHAALPDQGEEAL